MPHATGPTYNWAAWTTFGCHNCMVSPFSMGGDGMGGGEGGGWERPQLGLEARASIIRMLL